jgi:hypothetical protein
MKNMLEVEVVGCRMRGKRNVGYWKLGEKDDEIQTTYSPFFHI